MSFVVVYVLYWLSSLQVGVNTSKKSAKRIVKLVISMRKPGFGCNILIKNSDIEHCDNRHFALWSCY